MAFAQYEIPYVHGHDFGIGVDGPSASPMGLVVKGAVVGVAGATGGLGQFQMRRISETSDLESQLGIDATASYGAGLFSASARFKFAKDSKVQKESLFMIVTATVTTGFRQIDDPSLTDDARALAGNSEQFLQRYGDRFVRGISAGGLFIGVLNLQTDSHEEADSIAGELKGSYGLFSAEAKVKLEKIQNAHRSQLSVLVYKEGGPIGDSLEHPDDPVALYELLQRWLKYFDTNPGAAQTPYSVTIAPTTIATGPLPPNAADIEHAQDVLVLCARARSQTLDLYNLCDYILLNYSRFDFTASPRAAVLEAFKGFEIDLDTVAQAASAAINDPKTAKSPVDFAVERNIKYPCGVLPEVMPTLKPIPLPVQGGNRIWRVKSPMGWAGAVALAAMADGSTYAMGPASLHADGPPTHGYLGKYDTVSNAWSTLSAGSPLQGSAAVGPDQQVYLLGFDYVAPDRLEAYDPAKNSWRPCAKPPAQRYSTALVAGRNGKLYAIGGAIGQVGTQTTVGTVEEYDPATDTWVTKAPLPNIRWGFGVIAASNGKIYVVGGAVPTGVAAGQPGSLAAVTTVDEYDPATGVWASKAAMPTARYYLGLAAGSNGEIYAIGGDTVSWSAPPDNKIVVAPLATVEVYDPAQNAWSSVAPLNKARAAAGVATLPDGTLVVAGGCSKPSTFGVRFNDVEVFVPQ